MAGFLEQHFEKIANDYNGEYHFTQERVMGRGGSFLPLDKHYISITNGKNKISFYIEVCEIAFATVKTQIENAQKSKIFKLKKRSPFLLLFSKNKKSLTVLNEREDVRRTIEKILVETGLEKISKDSLFEPIIKFTEISQNLEVEIMFSMVFKDKEKVIRPIIEFLIKINSYIEM